MALGTFTSNVKAGQRPSAPVFADLVSFAGDGSYPTGGTAGFEALVRTLLKDSRDVIAVVMQDCGGYVPVYDRAADKLKVYEEGADAGAADEVTATTNLSGVTFNVLIISK
jgi:hypothetical protein